MTNGGRLPFCVMIVDDLEHQQLALETAIREVVPVGEFLKVKTFAWAQQILKGGKEISLAVIDLKLDGSDHEGIELVKLCRSLAHRKDTPTILITAHPDQKNRIMAMQVRVDKYISKLSDGVTAELQVAVRELLHIP